MIDIEEIEKVAITAGTAVMEIYNRDFNVEYKEDQSPLTEADRKSNSIICSKLKEKYPDIPLLSEENKEVAFEIRKEWTRYWLIDPIDGTKEFIQKRDDFTINIALIEYGKPTLGVVFAPARKLLYSGSQVTGARLNGKNLPQIINEAPYEKINVVASRSHLSRETEDYIADLKRLADTVEIVPVGSSLKLCYVAEGKADCYPRLAPTMEWDTAAAHAIVNAAGKSVKEFNTDAEIRYNKPNLLNPWFVVS